MPVLPRLEIVGLEQMIFHERHDDQRSKPLILRIRSSGVIRNPPIVMPLGDHSDRFMVLDGANRITALREMGFRLALVQVVESDDPGLTLHTWNHAVWELNPDRFLTTIQKIPGLELIKGVSPPEAPQLHGGKALAVILFANGDPISVNAPATSLERQVDLLRALVESYQSHGRIDRSSETEVQPLVEIYPSFCGIVVFPKFKVEDLLSLANRGCLLPAGITRFTISPRILHLNYPLEKLNADSSLESKNTALQKWVQDKLALKAVRYYAEATYLFDE